MSGELSAKFLESITAEIDHDVPRLMFADHLDESGSPERAEFVRAQVERARLPQWHPRQLPLRLREEQLLRDHGESWLAAMPHIEGVRWEGFRRGIVAEVSFASFEALREQAHAVRAVAPVEAVTVRWPRRRETRKDPPPVAELRELNLTGRPESAAVVARLAGSPQLATLSRLTARALSPETLVPLVSSPHLSRLKSLRLPNNNLGNDGVTALVGAAVLGALEELDLSGDGVSERYEDDPEVSSPGMETLAAWPGLSSVKSLNLSGNQFGVAGLRTLLRAPTAVNLKRLEARQAALDPSAPAEFAAALPGLMLEWLDLGDNYLEDRGAASLAKAACLATLKVLRLDRCELTSNGVASLAGGAYMAELRRLDLSHTAARIHGLRALLASAPPHLHTLRLRDAELNDDAVEVLAQSPASMPLQDLDLSRNSIRYGLTHLGGSPHLPNLVALRAGNNTLSPSGLADFRDSELGKRLLLLDTGDGPDADETQDDIAG